ncbi:MAG: 3CxxC-type zinc finger protein [Candidatus Harrisonbacteria bacterium]|nr:3CxxC-type zinc finger protein [Candidatus Harrisonbacteria bacterium]
MTPQAVVAAALHRMMCEHCGQKFPTQLSNVTFHFHRSEDKARAWFEARCLHCGKANAMNQKKAGQLVDAEVLRRAFDKYDWEHPTV